MSVRSVAGIAACAAVVGGLIAYVPLPEQHLGPGPEAQLAETVRLAGVAATSLACVTGPPWAVDINPWAIPEGEGTGTARPAAAADPPGAPTPAEALAARFQGAYAQFPRLPYAQERLPGDRVLFTHAVGGRVKIAITVGPNPVGQGYSWLQYAKCNPEELRLAGDWIEIWSDADGKPLPTAAIVGQAPLPGRDDCDGAGVSLLWVGGGQPYVRDPRGTFTGATRSPYEAATALPVDAIDTGVHRDGAVLWLARDRSAVFLVRPDGVERLPREKGERGYCG